MPAADDVLVNRKKLESFLCGRWLGSSPGRAVTYNERLFKVDDAVPFVCLPACLPGCYMVNNNGDVYKRSFVDECANNREMRY